MTPRAIAARRAARRRTARARPGRARRPRAPARESGRHSACGAAVETNLVTFTSAIGGARNALAPPHRVRTSRRARRALASTRRPPPPVAQIAGSVSARGVMSSTADLRSRSGRPVDDDDLCTAVAAVEPMRDLLVGLPHLWGPSPLGTPQFGVSSLASRGPRAAVRPRRTCVGKASSSTRDARRLEEAEAAARAAQLLHARRRAKAGQREHAEHRQTRLYQDAAATADAARSVSGVVRRDGVADLRPW